MLDKEASDDVRLLFSYDDDEIGSRMTTNFIMIHNHLTIRQAMRELVEQAGENDNISTIYVIDEEDKFYGAIDLKDLIIAREYTDLEDIISHSYPYVMDHEKVSDCIDKIRDYAEDSIPVLQEDGTIAGIITSQDIVEAVDDEMGDDYAKLAGLTAEEDLNETLPQSIKKRLPWLIVLLFQALLLAHGGLTTLGANTFSMAIAGPFVSWLLYRILSGFRINRKVSLFAAAFLGDLFTYCVTAFQLALAHNSATSFSIAFRENLVIFAGTQIPLAVVEGLLTVAIVIGLESYAQPELAAVGFLKEGTE